MQPIPPAAFKSLASNNLLDRWIRRGRFLRLRHLSPAKPLDPQRTAQPIVVAALGGSGTRAIVELLVESGIFMGEWVDRSTGDSLFMRRFLHAHFDDLVHEPESDDPRMRRDLYRAVRAHRSGIPHESDDWGWKNPRSMWILPSLVREFPRLRFIHLVRDGRDLALSDNNFLLDDHGRNVLGERYTGDPIRDQFELWAMGNLRAADASARLLGPRALLIRYEDLCADPMREIERLHRFIGRPLPRAAAARIAASVRPSSTLGRGVRSDSETLRACTARHAQALHRFGYATPDC
jgi:hypothetical protein